MSSKWSKFPVLLTASFLVGFLLRAEGLLRRSYWLDEVLTFWRVRQSTIDHLLVDLESAPFPPLYYLVLWGWTRVLGVNELSVRALPMLFGVLALPATYLVWTGLIGRRNALWAVLLLSTNAFHMFYSQDAKMYAAVWFLATLSSGAFLHALEESPRRGAWLAVYGVSNAALLQTSYVGVVPLAIQAFYGFVAFLRRRPFPASVTIVALLSCLPAVAWLPTTFRTVTERTGISWIPPTKGGRVISELSEVFGYYLLGYRTVSNPPNDLYGRFFSSIYGPLKYLAGAVMLTYLIQLARGWKDARREVSPARLDTSLYLVLWSLLPALAAFLFSIIIYPLWGPPRYLMASGPGILLLLASALGSLKRQALACGFGLALISANATLILFEKSHVTSDPYRQMVGLAATLARESPGHQGDPSNAPDASGMIYLDNGTLSDWNAVCVKYEIDEINKEGRTYCLRLDTLGQAVSRAEKFFVIELLPYSLKDATSLEGRIVSLSGTDVQGA